MKIEQLKKLLAHAEATGDRSLARACRGALAPAMGRKAERDAHLAVCALAWDTLHCEKVCP